MRLEIEMATPSLANARLHWRSKHRLVKGQRNNVHAHLIAAAAQQLGSVRARPQLPLIVTMTRCGANPMDDDNLAGAFKAVRDAIAAWLGIDDRDARVRWVCKQTPQRKRKPYITLELAHAAENH